MILQLSHSKHLHRDQHKAYHSRSKIRHLKLVFIGSEQYRSLELAPVELLHFTFFCCKLVLSQNQLFKTWFKSFFPLTSDETRRHLFMLHFSSMFSSPLKTMSQVSVEAGQVQQFLWIWQTHLTKMCFSLMLNCLVFWECRELPACQLKKWWPTRESFH